MESNCKGSCDTVSSSCILGMHVYVLGIFQTTDENKMSHWKDPYGHTTLFNGIALNESTLYLSESSIKMQSKVKHILL